MLTPTVCKEQRKKEQLVHEIKEIKLYNSLNHIVVQILEEKIRKGLKEIPVKKKVAKMLPEDYRIYTKERNINIFEATTKNSY